MVRPSYCSFAAACGAVAAMAALAFPVKADDAQIQRGKYLVTITGCSDCHTPGALIGQPDMARYLGFTQGGRNPTGAGR
jgi:mono/diheme cytochrome c family protein